MTISTIISNLNWTPPSIGLVKWDLWWIKWRWVRFPCQSPFQQILHPHNHLGQIQWAISGRRAEWTLFGLHRPPPPHTLRRVYTKTPMFIITLWEPQTSHLLSSIRFKLIQYFCHRTNFGFHQKKFTANSFYKQWLREHVVLDRCHWIVVSNPIHVIYVHLLFLSLCCFVQIKTAMHQSLVIGTISMLKEDSNLQKISPTFCHTTFIDSR
jgi:hypothetical protein